jgi:hypothetical protein
MGIQHTMTASFRQISQASLEEPEYSRTRLSTPMMRIVLYVLAQFLVRRNHRLKMSVVIILLSSLTDLGVPIVWPPDGTMHLMRSASQPRAHCLFLFLTTAFSETQKLRNFPILCGRLYPSRALFATVCEHKGQSNKHTVGRLCQFLRASGATDIVYKSDQEKAAVSVIQEAIRVSMPLVIHTIKFCSRQSLRLQPQDNQRPIPGPSELSDSLKIWSGLIRLPSRLAWDPVPDRTIHSCDGLWSMQPIRTTSMQ